MDGLHRSYGKKWTATISINSVLLTFQPNELMDGFEGPSSLVSVPEMRPLVVVVTQPSVECLLYARRRCRSMSHAGPRERNSSRAVPLKRSTNPLDLGFRTLVRPCSMPLRSK